MRFGFHVSIAGGFARVRRRAEEVHAETMQLFAGNPRAWTASPLDPDDVARFRVDVRESGITPVFVHAPYLPNLASADPVLSDRSVGVLVEHVRRCRSLGIRYLVSHVGRAGPSQAGEAIARVAASVNMVFDRASANVLLLLENTAGMGTEIGHRFEDIRAIIDRTADPGRVGVVLDTAHLFQAGYDIRNRAALDGVLREFDRVVGLGRLHMLHLNDSLTEFGSRKDRHWHIGKGQMGLEAFRSIVNHPLLGHLPCILETPRDGAKDDLRNLATIRRLLN